MATKARVFFLVGPLLSCLCLHAGPVDSGAGKQANEAEIQRYSREAERAISAKDLDAAAAALKKLAALTPDVPEVHTNLGMVYYNQSRYTEAAEEFERAVKLKPAIAGGTLMVGLCDSELGRWEHARPLLEKAFLHPPNAEIGRTVGIKLMAAYTNLDQSFKALETSEELLKRFPSDPEILYRASHLYGDRALQTMNRLAEVAPQSPWKVMAFAEALEGQKHYDLAVIQYRKVIAADPSMPGVHYRLGRALLLNKADNDAARDEAMKEFQEALVRDPRNAGAEYEVGEIYRRRGDAGQASGHFFRATQIDPQLEDAQIAVARALISFDKPQESVSHLRAAIKVNPGNEVSHFYLAKAYKSLGETAASEHEMALYQECHARSLLGATAAESQSPTGSADGAVSRQASDSDNPN